MSATYSNKHRKLEKYLEVVRLDGLNTDQNVNIGVGSASKLWVSGAATMGSTLGVTGNATFSTNVTVTGNITAGGTISQSGVVPTVFHSGGTAPFSGVAATSGATNASVVTTDTYVAEVFIPANTTLTGISVLNGTAVAGHLNVGLADNTGTVVAKSATAVSGSGTSTYQQIPFTATYAATGPSKYYVLLQGDNTSGRFNAHTIGNFGAFLVTSETYGTFVTTATYLTTTFTTAQGPVADTY